MFSSSPRSSQRRSWPAARRRRAGIGLLVLGLVSGSLQGFVYPAAADEDYPRPVPELGDPVDGADAGEVADAEPSPTDTSVGVIEPGVVPVGSFSVALPITSDNSLSGQTAPAVAWQPVGETGINVAVDPATPSAGSPEAGLNAAAAPTVAIDVLSEKEAEAIGATGLAMRVTRTDAGNDLPITLSVPASLLNGPYGADYASRLRWIQMPEDTVDTGEAELAASTVDTVSGGTVVSTQASGQPMLLVAASGPVAENGTGDFSATSLSPASSWQVSTQTGSLSWSYPFRVPPAAAGPEPELAFDYDSGLVDGQTGVTNNQSSAVGLGWDLSGSGFIERTYVPCSLDADAGTPKTGDLCWKSDNATVSFGGHSGPLVKASDGTWRLEGDDGTKIEKLTGAANGSLNGEYWLMTTTDGTKYYFGLTRLPGWTAGGPVTSSTWNVPVYGNNTDEPCNAGTFVESSCLQAWRWNLDYVVDPNANSMAYYYTAEHNRYASNMTNGNATDYVRGGQLARIDYGMRAGSELIALAPQRVVFDPANRCVIGSPCAGGDTGSFPDTPWDQNCTAAPCTGKYSPTFWTTTRFGMIHTQLLSGSTYSDVDSWTVTNTYPDPGDGTKPAMWLSAIVHTGHVGTPIAMPQVHFSGVTKQNRVWAVDGLAPLSKYRISSVDNESGGVININYADQQCSPSNLPAAPESNTMRCFPQWWAPPVGPEKLDYFHKYPVVEVSANAGNTQTTDVTTYDYSVGTPGWRYNDSPFLPEDKRTWSEWAGYSKVRVKHGDPNVPTAQQTTEYVYYQGLNGDRSAPAGGTKTVNIAASDGSSMPDSIWFAGNVREETSTDGAGGPIVSGTITTYWASPPTASDGITNARMTGPTDVVTKTTLSAGGVRTTQVKTTYDFLGRPTKVNDLGDTNVATDNQCTTTTYADNGTDWLLSYPAEVVTLSQGCGEPAVPSTDTLSHTRTFYDSSTTLGAPPSKGNQTKVSVVKGFSGLTPQWITPSTVTYDTLGRPLSTVDVLDRTTSIAYTPSAGGPLTKTVATNPKSWTTTTTYNPAWGAITSLVDVAGKRTEATYDALGRRVGVWLPGRDKATNPIPSMGYAYTVSRTAPNTVATTTLTPSGGTVTSWALYDGLLRPRQTQAPSEGGGRIVTDTLYGWDGQVTTTNSPYYALGNPGGSLYVPNEVIPQQIQNIYDGAGRQTAAVTVVMGSETWRTSTAYGGDHVDITPPTGATATTTYTDARGKTTELRQYHGPTPTGDYDTTAYGYSPAGNLTSLTDAAGNQWTWKYDLLGNQVEAVDPDTGTTTKTYDNAGRLLTSTDSRPVTLAYSYDELDRKTGVYHDTTGGTQLARWTYDTLANGSLTKSTRYITTTSGTAEYITAVNGYDTAGRPTGTTTTIPAGQTGLTGSYTTTFTYGDNGALRSQKVPAAGGIPQETIFTNYDNLGMPIGLSGGVDGPENYAGATVYTHLNELAQFGVSQGANWLNRTYYYADGTRRLTRALTTAATPGASDRAYTYNPAGNITSVVNTTAPNPTDTQCFTYDYLQRITEAWTPAASDCATAPSSSALGGPAPYWQSYGYDVTGNRTSITHHAKSATGLTTTDTYAYPAPGGPQPHALQSVTHTITGDDPNPPATTDTYGYSNTGSTTSATVQGTPQTFSYDLEGHLDTATVGGQAQSNIYDADGNLLIRTEPGRKTLYLGDSELHVNGGTQLSGTRTYTFAGRPIAERTTQPGGSTSKVSWLDSDNVNTGTIAQDSTTGAITRRHLDPFGNPRDPSAVAWPSGHGYLNKPISPLSKLTHLGAREYNPDLGRFTTIDPILDSKDPQQLNGYNYANNSPISRSDPTGTLPTCNAPDGVDCGALGKKEARYKKAGFKMPPRKATFCDAVWAMCRPKSKPKLPFVGPTKCDWSPSYCKPLVSIPTPTPTLLDLIEQRQPVPTPPESGGSDGGCHVLCDVIDWIGDAIAGSGYTQSAISAGEALATENGWKTLVNIGACVLTFGICVAVSGGMFIWRAYDRYKEYGWSNSWRETLVDGAWTGGTLGIGAAAGTIGKQLAAEGGYIGLDRIIVSRLNPWTVSGESVGQIPSVGCALSPSASPVFC